jgi:bacteriocin biosynthesis cyclodehydratase domain-containing protein
MRRSDGIPSVEAIRLRDVYGVFVLSPDVVQFRTGSMSGTAYLVSDPEQRGLLGPVVERLLTPDATQRRPWNDAEAELLAEILPQLQDNGIVEADDIRPLPDAIGEPIGQILRKPLAQSRIAIVGHGVLGEAVRSLLTGMPCGSVTILESSSVARAGEIVGSTAPWPPLESAAGPDVLQRALGHPQDQAQWAAALGGYDWAVAAQDCFEPEELTALNRAALQHSLPWSLVCFDGYEGWVGPTFVPGQTACFSCFQRRLFAGAAEPKHVFMDPRVRVCRVPSPWSAGPETGAWVSLMTSIFALELIAATQGRSFTLNQMLIVHRLNLTFQRETVLRLPRCPDCSPRGNAPAVNVFANSLSTRQRQR